MYPKDTVSQKKLDRVDDRSNRRIDLLKTNVNDLKVRIADLENQFSVWFDVLNNHISGGEDED